MTQFLEILAEQASKRPSKIAAKYRDDSITYSELWDKINHFSSFLISRDIKIGDRVGIYLYRNLEALIAILAVMNAGASYVPLDPDYPKERLSFIIKDAELKAIITSGDRIDDQICSVKILNINDQKKFSTEKFPFQNILPHHLAYILYTSGSSGRPKGVEITHSNLFNFINLSSKRLDIESSDVCLLSASFNYALSVRQIFIPLSKGATLVIADSTDLQDPQRLLTLIKKEKISQVDFVPSHFRSILNYLKSLDNKEIISLSSNSLRRIVTVGEALTADIVNCWYHELIQNCQIVNIFGQTETTGIVCSYSTEPDKIYNSIVPIGKPIPETQIYIVDENLELTETGGEGELCITNPCVAKGYLNLSELSSKKFINNPFNKDSIHSLYRTGDLVRMNIDGNIEYLGRIDSQIKIRGMRVEIGDIESNINSYKCVKESVVVLQRSEDNISKLVCFIVLNKDQEFFEQELRSFLSAKLPAHMIPVEYRIVNDLPRTPNGKVDRNALTIVNSEEIETEVEDETISETERKLLQLWKKILRIKNINISDNFFNIGGDSLSAVNLFILIEHSFQKLLPVSTLYNNPTIESLTKVIEDEKYKNIPKSLVSIKTSGSKPPLFFIHGASGNILLYRDLVKYIDPEVPFYGLQSYGLDGNGEVLTDIKVMASKYLDEIKAIQPVGPYFLGGYCMGGSIALEIAQQLKKENQEIAALFLLETYNWCSLPGRNFADRSYHNFQKIVFHFNNVTLLRGADLKLFVGNKWNELLNRRKIWIGKVKNLFGGSNNSSNKYHRILAKIWQINDKAAFEYESKYYDGEIIHILPAKRYKVHNTVLADWENNAKSVKRINLSVYAAGMLVEPFVKILAAEINKILFEKYKKY